MKITKSYALLDDDGKLLGGKWELDKKHQISYRIKGKKETIQFKTQIIDVQPTGLTVLLSRTQGDKGKDSRVIQFKGFWKLDPKNRIQFDLKRSKGSSNTLHFKNKWTINKHHEITYSYQEDQLKTKTNKTKTLIFRGHWDILKKNRITYYIKGSSQSQLIVRGTFQTKSIRAKKGEIRYQFGIELNKKIKTQTLTFFGKWRYSRKFGLQFEIKYRDGKKHSIILSGQYQWINKNKINIRLMNKDGQGLGIEFELTRQFLNKEGNAFIRYFKSNEETLIEGGLYYEW